MIQLYHRFDTNPGRRTALEIRVLYRGGHAYLLRANARVGPRPAAAADKDAT